MSATSLDYCFGVVVKTEGGWGNDPKDPGNWTGGRVGVGENLGTKYGVDTASYPDALRTLPPDIRATMPATVKDLTIDQAKTVFRYCYWNKVAADQLPAPLALIVVDSAYNNGVDRAARWLQTAAGLTGDYVDGSIGPQSLAAVAAVVAAHGVNALCAEFHAERIDFMARLTELWESQGRGWSRRLATLPYQSLNVPA